jgi:putative flippase GtrA
MKALKILGYLPSSKLWFFLICGLINTAVGFVTFNFAYYILMSGVIFSNFMSVLAGTISGYLLSRNLVFTYTGPDKLKPYILLNLILFFAFTYFINLMIKAGLEAFIAWLLLAPLAALLSFFAQKKLIFLDLDRFK